MEAPESRVNCPGVERKSFWMAGEPMPVVGEMLAPTSSASGTDVCPGPCAIASFKMPKPNVTVAFGAIIWAPEFISKLDPST